MFKQIDNQKKKSETMDKNIINYRMNAVEESWFSGFVFI